MSDGDEPATTADSDDVKQPEFRGCMFCYSAEWTAYAAKRGYRVLSK